MKQTGVLDIQALRHIGNQELEKIIKPSGFYRQKSNTLKLFVNVLYDICNANIQLLSNYDTIYLRKLLLTIKGVGPETVDSILLYALKRPVFVVDTYTKRFLRNHKLYQGDEKYDTIQSFFMTNLPTDTYLFNEFHALIVHLGKNFCRKVPACEGCPLAEDMEKVG